MAKHLFRILRVQVENAPRLYPRGIDWRLHDGMNVVAGGTGLGKTTFVHAALFGLLGSLGESSKRDVEKVDATYFKGRLRRADDPPGDPPTITVDATFGTVLVSVQRRLSDGRVLQARVDGTRMSEVAYRQAIGRAVGVRDYAALQTLVDKLLYLAETPHLLTWDSVAQNEVMAILFGTAGSYGAVTKLWQELSSADSTFRNARFQAQRVESRLASLRDQSGTGKVDGVEERRSELRRARQACEDARDAAVRRLQATRADVARLKTATVPLRVEYLRLAKRISDAESELERATNFGQSGRALLVFEELMALCRDPSANSCVCCSQRPSVSSEQLVRTRTALDAGACPICGTSIDLPSTVLPQDQEAELIRNEMSEVTSQLRRGVSLLEQAEARARAEEQERVRLESELQAAREAEWRFMLDNPVGASTAVEQQEIVLRELRAEQERARIDLEAGAARFEHERDALNRRLLRLRRSITASFQEYCQLFLDQHVTVEFDETGERFRRRGPQQDPLHSAFFPVVDGDPRLRADALSDAQRTFVDLAFRMALLKVWGEEKGASMPLLVVETPEGGVDAAYMTRVAEMLRAFAVKGQVLVTTNLNNELFLPALLKSVPAGKRKERVLNLLESGDPRPLQKRHRRLFQRILERTFGGRP